MPYTTIQNRRQSASEMRVGRIHYKRVLIPAENGYTRPGTLHQLQIDGLTVFVSHYNRWLSIEFLLPAKGKHRAR